MSIIFINTAYQLIVLKCWRIHMCLPFTDIWYAGCSFYNIIQCVPLATEPGISLIILTPMKILQRGHFQHMLWCRHISYTMR